MITELQDHIAGYRLSGSVTSDQIDRASDELAELTYRRGSARLVLEIADDVDIEAETLWQQLRTDRDDIVLDRVAIIGSRSWHRTLTGLAGAAADIDIHHYPSDEQHVAWDWIRDGATPTAEPASA